MRGIVDDIFKLLNELRIFPSIILSKIENVYSQCNIEVKSRPNDSKKSVALIKEKDTESENFESDDTLSSYKDQKFKEIKQIITDNINHKKINSSAIIWSEKAYSNINELISSSFTQRSPHALEEYLSLQFNGKYRFKEINWNGTDDPLMSLTKLVFENFKLIEVFLSENYSFGTLHVLKNKDVFEYSLFLAMKEQRETSLDLRSKKGSISYLDTVNQ